MVEASQNGSTPGSTMPDAVYGFIGLGNMGFGMAKNLRASMPKQCKLVVCELNTERRDEFASSVVGLIEVADSPKSVAEQCDIVLTSLPNGNAVKKVFTDPFNGLLSASSSGRKKFFLETSTIEVRTSNEVLKEVETSGLGDFIDCPVSGGIPGAEQGNLTFMVGGNKDLFERAKPILATMGKEKNLIFCGPPGAGLATKQINNYVANVSYVALCEGMNTGIRYGLDPKVLADAINVGSGMSWNSLHMNPVKGVQPGSSASKDFKGGFRTELAKGVTDMAVQLMDDVGAKHVMADVVKDIYARAVNHPKCAGQECRSIYKLFSENDGQDLGTTSIE
ncbi:3-hydroxyisobutyrate dehydrogenase, variant [Exophiala viscosa]|uniref:3-hydroxyisobutyrate dehydrogenase n=1 Tax=Exophiala viscosa TaxID=2486360 RepID=A0AAN6ICR9_9EURO|nr:3-hydroxyisobutyrate dehydrogenase, variant [Exophiala viscosa]